MRACSLTAPSITRYTLGQTHRVKVTNLSKYEIFKNIKDFRLGKQTVFLLPETSGDLLKSTNLECTHLMHAKLVLFTFARARGDLAAGCMEAGIRLA